MLGSESSGSPSYAPTSPASKSDHDDCMKEVGQLESSSDNGPSDRLSEIDLNATPVYCSADGRELHTLDEKLAEPDGVLRPVSDASASSEEHSESLIAADVADEGHDIIIVLDSTAIESG